MNAQEKRAAAERERLRDKLKEQTLSAILDKEGGHVAQMEALLIYSIDRASKSADRLSRRVFWLNLLLLIIGIAALIVAGYGVLFK
ncbi:MAG: hypothetical protein IMZ53_03295 [Thermoplasmata archaeon]|nr:hypothetical protein [Thermoplasmata archaeon]